MGGKGKSPARATGPRCRGGYQVFACPIDRRLRLCSREGTQHLFVVVRRRPVCKAPPRGSRVPVCKAARGGHRQACVCGWPARVQAPRAGGTGACVQGRSRRPQAGAAWAVVARCVRNTSSRSASAACGVRGVRAAQQRGSRQCDDSAEQVAETPSS